MDAGIPKNTDQFVRQLMIHRKRIYAFIVTLVGNTTDADDIMQDTAAFMWEKYHHCDEVHDFAALGMRVAHFKVLEFRKKQYTKKIQFNSDLFDSVLGGAVTAEETIDVRFEALQRCLATLDETSRTLIQMRHRKDQTIQNIAASVRLSRHVAYKRIAQLHDRLVRCVQRTLREEGLL